MNRTGASRARDRQGAVSAAPSGNPSRLHRHSRRFYLRPTLVVARELIGCTLVRKTRRGILAGRIVEVEAYLGRRDPASHSYRGRTARNDVMFWEGGHLYVYFTYGMHYCANVVTETGGRGCAVLLRAAEPVAGVGAMARRRGLRPDDLREICNGPAKLCQALGIGRGENGADLAGETIFLAADRESARRRAIVRGPRVGIRAGTDRHYRYFEKGNRFVSGPRRTSQPAS